ncbi:helix-turn-helix transcriptional regulator [Amycolatopsis sp. NPDC089917]|uniref:helix-turn-helix domain-containing protein n=1 Tax=Amycolatopsis sp. NPDC089917 TaxID=3155187 RepID=UPI003431E46F
MTSTTPPETTANPDAVHTLADLATQVDRLRRHAALGHAKRTLSNRDVARLLHRELGHEIPLSTLGNYLAGRTLPPVLLFEALLRVLGVPDQQLGVWADAWDRLYDSLTPPRPTITAPPPRDSAPAQESRPRRAATAGVAAPAAALAATVLVTALLVRWFRRPVPDCATAPPARHGRP